MASDRLDPTELDHVLVALGHPVRRAMLRRLCHGPVQQGTLLQLAPVSHTSALKHIALLERAGLLERTRLGWRYELALQPEPIEALVDWLGALHVAAATPLPPPPAPSTNERVQQTIEAFLADVPMLVHRAAVEAVRLAVHDKAEAAARRSALPPPKSRASRPRKAPRRNVEEMAAVCATLLAEIQLRPGQTMAALVREVGVPRKDLEVPARKLVRTHLIEKRGVGSGTTYWPRTRAGDPGRRD